MATSFSGRKTAVRLSILPSSILASALLLTTPYGYAENLYENMRQQARQDQPGGYVFVSEHVPDATLIALARDARRARLTIVVNGFWGDLGATRARIARINERCCAQQGASWQINPLLFQRYRVTAVPSFVIAVKAGTGIQDFSKVTGEMNVENALKFFAQQSRIAEVRKFATSTYQRLATP